MPVSDAYLNSNPRPGQTPPVTVVILTYNEAVNIADCLESCRWCDDVHVLDSGSTDGTCDIARRLGAQVHQHPFTSFGQQRNWAIDNIPAKYPWHFHLDADERFTEPLVREILKEIGPDGTLSLAAAYLVPSKVIFLGKWLKHSGGYPAYQVRLFHSQRCRFIDFGNSQREQTRGPVATLVNPCLHYSFSKGMADWLAKLNRYSDHEYGEVLEALKNRAPWGDLLSRDRIVRRQARKILSYLLLRGRAWWRFLDMYLFRAGWLDAGPGLHYSALIAMYEYWTEIKLCEHRAHWPEATARLAQRLLAEPAAAAP